MVGEQLAEGLDHLRVALELSEDQGLLLEGQFTLRGLRVALGELGEICKGPLEVLLLLFEHSSLGKRCGSAIIVGIGLQKAAQGIHAVGLVAPLQEGPGLLVDDIGLCGGGEFLGPEPVVEAGRLKILSGAERLLGPEKFRPCAVGGIGGRQQVAVDLGEKGGVSRGVEGEESLEWCLRGGGASGVGAHDRVVSLEGPSVLPLSAESVRAEQFDLRTVFGIPGQRQVRILQHGIVVARLGREAQDSERGDTPPVTRLLG